MANDVFALLARLSVVGSAGILLVGVLRAPARRTVGAEAAYWLWLVVPASLVAVLLPRAPSCLCGPESYVSPLVIRGIGAPLELAPEGEVSDHVLALTMIWGIGAVAAFAYFAWCHHVLSRSLGRLQGRPDGTYSSAGAQQPMLVGACRPRIVLPSDFDSRYSGSERALILAHERAHVARHDALTNGIALALVCLLWFNPIGYWAWSRFRFDQELACDAAVLRRERIPRRRYARALAKTELATSMAIAFGWRRRHPLLERIAMLRHRTPCRTQRVAGYALALVLMLSATYVVWAAPPEEVSAAASSSRSAQGTPRAAPDAPPFGSPVAVSGRSIKVEKNRIVGPELEMIFAPRTPFHFQADSVFNLQAGGWRLAGHVRITAQVVHMVRASPGVITMGVRPVIASAEKAVLTPRQGGGYEVRLDRGSVQFY
ncbi:MAG: M56 family metallopeptidase [Steroidobacteraceae bacterium]